MAKRPGDAYRREFGQRLRVLRLDQNLSQEELAERSGLHRNYVGGVERGEINLSLENIHALANGLNVSVVELFVVPDTDAGRRAARKKRAR